MSVISPIPRVALLHESFAVQRSVLRHALHLARDESLLGSRAVLGCARG